MIKYETEKVNYFDTKIACIGDSLTYGSTLLNRKKECYPARLQRLLGEGYDVVNLGLVGHTVNSFCSKFWGQPAMIRSLAEYEPNYILFLLGTNDARLKNWMDEKVFRSEYTRLLQYLKNLSSSPTIIAMTSPSAFRETSQHELDFDVEVLERIVEIQRSVLKELDIKFIDLYSMTKDKEHLFAPDKLHLNSQGAKFVAYVAYLGLKDTIEREKQNN
ncbi:MAG: hypothetical protein K2H36_01795 [Clostridia bacterium]|nr:hypothetical protein [Clostridia bacterium]